jgi:molecular chaperone GrpE
VSDKRTNGRDEDAGLPAVVEPGAAEPANDSAPDENGLAPVETPASDELAALRRERDELREHLIRRRADFENYKKRVERDRALAGFEAAAAIFRELLSTVDNLERALRADATENALRAGVELTYRELLTYLEGQGVVVHDPTGQPFDPQSQQALMHEVAPGHHEGTVVEVFRKGYSYKDRLLRPALVKVAKAEGEPPEAGADDGIH